MSMSNKFDLEDGNCTWDPSVSSGCAIHTTHDVDKHLGPEITKVMDEVMSYASVPENTIQRTYFDAAWDRLKRVVLSQIKEKTRITEMAVRASEARAYQSQEERNTEMHTKTVRRHQEEVTKLHQEIVAANARLQMKRDPDQPAGPEHLVRALQSIDQMFAKDSPDRKRALELLEAWAEAPRSA